MVVGVTTRVDQPNARTGPSDDIHLREGSGCCPLGSADRLWRGLAGCRTSAVPGRRLAKAGAASVRPGHRDLGAGRARRYGKALTDDLQDATRPRWSPDGSRLDLATCTISALPDNATDEAEPAVAPDGKKAVFTVDAASIVELNLTTGQRRTIAPRADRHHRLRPRLLPQASWPASG